MAELSDYFENVIINLMRNVDYPEVAASVALFTAVTGLEADSGWTGTEVATGIGYTRQAAGLSAASGGASDNAAELNFGTATTAWGTVTHVALMDSATIGAGHVLMFSALDVEKIVGVGDTFKISANDLDVTMS